MGLSGEMFEWFEVHVRMQINTNKRWQHVEADKEWDKRTTIINLII